tara:strand:- start:267936 stop:268265 length:330 start_codon:yes stop_codon:yes gene_type:complete
MAEIIELPPNIIGKDDHESLESFAGHETSRGRLSRFHWDHKNNDDPILELYRGGVDEVLVCTVSRDREKGQFRVTDNQGRIIFTGDLNHVMKALDEKLTREHDEGEIPA